MRIVGDSLDHFRQALSLGKLDGRVNFTGLDIRSEQVPIPDQVVHRLVVQLIYYSEIVIVIVTLYSESPWCNDAGEHVHDTIESLRSGKLLS